MDPQSYFLRIPFEFLPHTERRDNEPASAFLLLQNAQDLQLHERFSKAELRENCPLASFDRPLHDIPLVRIEGRMDFGGLARNPPKASHPDLLFHEFSVSL
jgi:hypothetical protein